MAEGVNVTEGVRSYHYSWYTGAVGGLFECVAKICVFHWWSFFFSGEKYWLLFSSVGLSGSLNYKSSDSWNLLYIDFDSYKRAFQIKYVTLRWIWNIHVDIPEQFMKWCIDQCFSYFLWPRIRKTFWTATQRNYNLCHHKKMRKMSRCTCKFEAF